MAKERTVEKLSEKEIQYRLYGQYLAASKVATKKEEPKKSIEKPMTQKGENQKVKNIKIVWGFLLGIMVILILGFIFSGLEKSETKSPIKSGKAVMTTPNRPYTIQVMVYESKAGADKVVEDLKKRGFPAYLRENKTISGKLQLRIYVGDFTTPEEAKSTLAMLKNQPVYQESFIRKK